MSEKMHGPENGNSSQKDSKRRDAKFYGIVGACMALAIFVAFFLGGGLGVGDSQGGSGLSGDGAAQSAPDRAVVTSSTASAETATSSEASTDTFSLPTNITVQIEETRVTVGGVEVKDAADLKALLEEIHNDSRTYQLEEKNAILATHAWVVATFEELRIALQKD